MKYLASAILVIVALIFVAILIGTLANDREQAAIERSLAQERLVAQRQQYDQERWQLTLVAITSLSENASNFLRDALPFILAIILFVGATRNRSVSLNMHNFDTSEVNDDDE